MAVAVTGINGHSIAYTYEWVADEITDVASFNVPKDAAPGSTMLVAATGDVYILNTKKKLIQI